MSLPCIRTACAAGLALLAMSAVAASLAASPTSCTAKSGAQTVALVELFTSEGCNSCPPADRWLSSTFRDGASTPAIAVAFHVDYWDRLGWKDRFASAEYTQRQYDAVRAGAARFPYTPQVLVQGRDVPDWGAASTKAGPGRAIATASATRARADIALDAVPRDGAVAVKATARMANAADRGDSTLYLALTQDGLVSDVKAGENAGERLTHDHVVRAFRSSGRHDADGTLRFDAEFVLPRDGAQTFSVVAFVQKPANGEVLQALALPLSAQECSGTR